MGGHITTMWTAIQFTRHTICLGRLQYNIQLLAMLTQSAQIFFNLFAGSVSKRIRTRFQTEPAKVLSQLSFQHRS